jgi:hypothetical protein
VAITKPIPGSSPNIPMSSDLQSGVNANGGVGVVQAKGLSSDILAASDATVFTAKGGDIEILNAIFKTDSTGLAGGTNLEINTDNVRGRPEILSETVANLGANKTVDLFSASLVKQRTVIEEGKSIKIGCSGSNCTGTGVWELDIEYRPLVGTASFQ